MSDQIGACEPERFGQGQDGRNRGQALTTLQHGDECSVEIGLEGQCFLRHAARIPQRPQHVTKRFLERSFWRRSHCREDASFVDYGLRTTVYKDNISMTCQSRHAQPSKLSKMIAAINVAALLSACAHTTPNPVQTSQVGDENMSCRSIENEMQDMETERADSDAQGTGQVAKNVGLGIAGAFLLVPWFFMDTGNAHSVEAKAAQARYKRLHALYQDKGCMPTEKPVEKTPSSELHELKE